MARSAKGHQEELGDDDDDEELLTGNSSSSLNKVKVDEPSRGKRGNPHRSKHSETEQRRRSKINERFQILRDIIPQNDQKRDKASFLLEVIEYIQFLQEKLQIYEQSYEGWNQEPTKLIPWRNHHGLAENNTDPSQAIQNGSVHEKNNDVSPSLIKNVQNPLESDFSTTTIQKGTIPGSATEAVPLTMQMRLDMFDPVVSSGMVTQHLQEPVSNADMPSHTQPQMWFSKPDKVNYTVPDNTLKEQEELTIESGSESISSAYSQGILDTLTQALQSSGVDLSRTSVSVQIDVGRRANTGLTPSKGHENQFVSNKAIPCSGVDYCSEDSEQSLKRLRREAS
ncbi:transcription factor BIM2-like [Gastrolobium bilobum]|uniref:transcription factor BIM2-like n=1 Tax=Gastrolobium bilobum TaxID=150636 RepID=UPI002AB101D1|nr:transcription factor BIM2-like [Gastrolobium bilobum]